MFPMAVFRSTLNLEASPKSKVLIFTFSPLPKLGDAKKQHFTKDPLGD
jgi:hypothetical protein